MIPLDVTRSSLYVHRVFGPSSIYTAFIVGTSAKKGTSEGRPVSITTAKSTSEYLCVLATAKGVHTSRRNLYSAFT